MLPTPCQKRSGTMLRSPPAAWPRGHSQQGLGLLPEKASCSLWEGFPLPGWKGWLKGVRQPEPCPATSLLSGCLSCQLEIRFLHKHVVQTEAFPKVPSCRLAASRRGLRFVNISTSTGSFCFSQPVVTNPRRVTSSHVNHPTETITAIKHQKTEKETQSQEVTCHHSGSCWGCVTAWI